MAREDTHRIPLEPRYTYPGRAATRTTRLFHAFLGRRWRPLGHRFDFPLDSRTALSPAALGSPAHEDVLEQVVDGDITLDSISDHCRLTLESRHGSIMITRGIGQWVQANLKAAQRVTIGEGLDRHSVVQIAAHSDVTIGQSISGNVRATITSAAGKIDIGGNVDAFSEARLTAGAAVRIGQDLDRHAAARITAQGDVAIGGSINQQGRADIISLEGTITIGQAVKEGAIGLLTAGRTVQIGDRIGQHAQITVLARGDVTVGRRIEQQAAAKITTIDGSITIGHGLSSGAIATFSAPNGSISIGERVDNGSSGDSKANDFDCPYPVGTTAACNNAEPAHTPASSSTIGFGLAQEKGPP